MPPEQTLEAPPSSPIPMPTRKQQSWGTIVSIVIIVLMIVVGAFYSWGERIAQQQALIEAASSTANTY